MSLLVVGTVAFDSIETPFGKAERIVGGAATYASLAASFLTKPVHMVSVVGSDFPETQLAAFRARGMDTSGILVKEGEDSFFWSGRYHMDMNSRDTLETRLNVLADLTLRFQILVRIPTSSCWATLRPPYNMPSWIASRSARDWSCSTP